MYVAVYIKVNIYQDSVIILSHEAKKKQTVHNEWVSYLQHCSEIC